MKSKEYIRGILTGTALTTAAVLLVGMGGCSLMTVQTTQAANTTQKAAAETTGAEEKQDVSERYAEIENKLEYLDQIIDAYYLNDDEVDVDAMIEGIYAGYISGLDEDYTTYYTAEEYKEVMESTSGAYSGIGVVVSQNRNTGIMTVLRPFEGAPGYEAGMLKDDILYKVAGEEVTGEDISKVVAKIKGEEGTTVDITVYRPSTDEYIDMVVERRLVEIPTVEGQMLEDNIGYIQIAQFDEVTTEQFEEVLKDLENQGMEGLIVDVRDNPGGVLDTVCDMLDIILPKELLVYTEDKNGRREEKWADDDSVLDLPMVVLANENSASASEIFCGTLQDYNRAEIIGTTTFGKGIVQVVVPLTDGSAVKVTTSTYYTPLGRSIHGIGIEPDVEVALDREAQEDNQLAEAINRILEKIQ